VDQYAERFETFNVQDMKRSGAYVYLDSEGHVCIERGLVRREEEQDAPDGAAGRVVTGATHAPKERPLHGEKLCKRLKAHLEAERGKWARMLLRRAGDLLAWLLQQDTDVMSNLFAFCVAATVDGISAADCPHAVNEVANTLKVDLARYWKPTRAAYFEHVAKDRIVTVVGESVAAGGGGTAGHEEGRGGGHGGTAHGGLRLVAGSATQPRGSAAHHVGP
jgi:hypothetical protein